MHPCGPALPEGAQVILPARFKQPRVPDALPRIAPGRAGLAELQARAAGATLATA